MKKSPQNEKLEEILRSSKLVSGGFLGTDPRDLLDIIDSDTADVSGLGKTTAQFAARMQQITDIATSALGNWVKVDEKRQAVVEEVKGFLICPWPHPGKFAKRVTTVKLTDSDETIRWSDLNIHLIAEHSFFEGKGSPFRVEPKELIRKIF